MNDDLWNARHALLYRCRLSAIYHRKRERFFDGLDRLAKATAVIGGSAALARALPDIALPWVLAFITVSSTLSLTFAWGERARRHADLARGFLAIERDIITAGELDENAIARFDAAIIEAENGEPRALATLTLLCQNEIALAEGQPEKAIAVPAYRRWLAQVLDGHVSPAA